MTPFRRSGRTGGDEGLLTQEEIRVLQRALQARGYDLGSSGADGLLGSVTSTTSKTRAAIRAFQTSQNLASAGQSGYGMLGPRTQAALAQAAPSVGRDYFARGVELFSIRSYAGAASAFESARQATGNVGYYFNVGRAHEQAGDDAAAILAYEALLAAGSPGVGESEVQRRLGEARARLAAVRALTSPLAPSAPPPASPASPGASPAASPGASPAASPGASPASPGASPAASPGASPAASPTAPGAPVAPEAPGAPGARVVAPAQQAAASAAPVLALLVVAAAAAAVAVVVRSRTTSAPRALGTRAALVPRQR